MKKKNNNENKNKKRKKEKKRKGLDHVTCENENEFGRIRKFFFFLSNSLKPRHFPFRDYKINRILQALWLVESHLP